MQKPHASAALPDPDDIDQVSAEYSDLFAALLPPDQAARHRREWYHERKERHGWSDAEIDAYLARDATA